MWRKFHLPWWSESGLWRVLQKRSNKYPIVCDDAVLRRKRNFQFFTALQDLCRVAGFTRGRWQEKKNRFSVISEATFLTQTMKWPFGNSPPFRWPFLTFGRVAFHNATLFTRSRVKLSQSFLCSAMNPMCYTDITANIWKKKTECKIYLFRWQWGGGNHS